MSRITSGYHKDFERLLDRIEDKYGYEMFNMDGIGDQLNLTKFNKKFFKNKSATADISVDGNSNVSDRSVVTYNPELVKPINRLNSYYMLWKQVRKLGEYRMADEIIEDSISGKIYINDFHGYGNSIPYCFNYSTLDIMTQGLGGLIEQASEDTRSLIKNWIDWLIRKNGLVPNLTIEPPKHLSSFKSQLEQFVIIASNSTLGATGLADMLLTTSIYMENVLNRCGDASFYFKDEDSCWAYLFEVFVSMVYTFNQPMRASQSPFTNVSVYDDYFLDSMLEHYINPKTMLQVDKNLVKKVQDTFLHAMNHVMSRTVVTFPVVTACYSLDNDRNIQDEQFLFDIAEHNRTYYFINHYGGTTSTLSSCCRLRSDVQNEYFNSFGAGSSKIGSLGVVTVNLPRIAYESYGSPDIFMEKLEDMSTKAFYINYTKRLLLQERIDTGKHPLYSLGFIDERKQYGTLGFNGFNEAIEIMKLNPLKQDGINFGHKMLRRMNEVNDSYGRHFKVPVNLEQIPAENVSIKLAKKDRYLGLNKTYKLYSNQFIPLTTEADLLDRIRLQGGYDSACSGGSILHINDSADATTVEDDTDLTRYIFKQGVIYFARNKLIKVCKNGHVFTGKPLRDSSHIELCPKCGEQVKSNWTRVVGFITQVDNWIPERREVDFPNREFYNKFNSRCEWDGELDD